MANLTGCGRNCAKLVDLPPSYSEAVIQENQRSTQVSNPSSASRSHYDNLSLSGKQNNRPTTLPSRVTVDSDRATNSEHSTEETVFDNDGAAAANAMLAMINSPETGGVGTRPSCCKRPSKKCLIGAALCLFGVGVSSAIIALAVHYYEGNPVIII